MKTFFSGVLQYFFLPIFIIFLIHFPLFVIAQKDNVDHVKASLHAEIFGNAGYLSTNLDIRFIFESKSGFAFRAGFGGKHFDTYGFPVELIYIYNLKKSHNIEMGGGITFLMDDDWLYFSRIGYRYQELSKSGLFFKIAFTPYYRGYYWDPKYSNKIKPYGGISVGYSF
jgi:hypothetical protein